MAENGQDPPDPTHLTEEQLAEIEKQKKAEEERQVALRAKLEDKDIQGEIDRRVTAALKKAEIKFADREKKAREDAERKAREDKLVEENKHLELYEMEKKRRESLEATMKASEKRDKVNALLDKKMVIDPDLRKLFHSFQGDLEELDGLIDSHQKTVKSVVEKEIAERLKTTPPPRGEDRPPAIVVRSRQDLKTPADKAKFIDEHGLGEYKKLPATG